MHPASEITLGFILTILAGVLNGSWNAAFSPQWNLAVANDNNNNRRGDDNEKLSIKNNNNNNNDCIGTKNDEDLDYHLAFALFQIYAVLLNIVVCLLWAGGPTNIGVVLAEAAPTDIALLSLFGFLWGLGSLGFGLACKIAGVGVGTNLTMGLIVVLGTFLPLLYKGVIKEATGWVILVGLAVCLVGLVLSTKSLMFRDEDEEAERIKRDTIYASSLDDDNNVLEDEMVAQAGENGDGGATPSTNSGGDASCPNSETKKNDTNTTTQQEERPSAAYSTWHKIAICMGSGLLATQLQFAFVFGQDIIDLADAREETPKGGGAAIVWLFAISIGAPPIVAYMLYHTQRRSYWTISFWWRTVGTTRHLKLIGSTCVPWVAHIHLYGLVSNTLLPSTIGSSIAWPLLMMTTVAQGMLLSLYMGEWKHASNRTRRILHWGLGCSAAGMAVLMASAAV